MCPDQRRWCPHFCAKKDKCWSAIRSWCGQRLSQVPSHPLLLHLPEQGLQGSAFAPTRAPGHRTQGPARHTARLATEKMVKIIGYWCWSSFSSWRPRTLEFGKVVGLGSDLIVGQGRGMEPRDRLDTCPSWRQILVRVLINDHSWSGWSCWYLPLCLPPVIFKFLVAKLGKKGIFWGQKRQNPVFFLQRKSVNKNICNKCSLLQWKFVYYLNRSVTELRVSYVFGSPMTAQASIFYKA